MTLLTIQLLIIYALKALLASEAFLGKREFFFSLRHVGHLYMASFVLFLYFTRFLGDQYDPQRMLQGVFWKLENETVVE